MHKSLARLSWYLSHAKSLLRPVKVILIQQLIHPLTVAAPRQTSAHVTGRLAVFKLLSGCILSFSPHSDKLATCCTNEGGIWRGRVKNQSMSPNTLILIVWQHVSHADFH